MTIRYGNPTSVQTASNVGPAETRIFLPVRSFLWPDKTSSAASIILSTASFTSDVAKYYRKSDIFIFPSKGEGLSNSFIEALSYGLSCIAFRNTSFPELQTLGFDFFLAEDQNIQSLEESLLQSVNYIESNPIPLQENISLAKKLFSKERELNDFLSIMK